MLLDYGLEPRPRQPGNQAILAVPSRQRLPSRLPNCVDGGLHKYHPEASAPCASAPAHKIRVAFRACRSVLHDRGVPHGTLSSADSDLQAKPAGAPARAFCFLRQLRPAAKASVVEIQGFLTAYS